MTDVRVSAGTVEKGSAACYILQHDWFGSESYPWRTADLHVQGGGTITAVDTLSDQTLMRWVLSGGEPLSGVSPASF